MLLITNHKTLEVKRHSRSSLSTTPSTDHELEAKSFEVQAHRALGERQRVPGIQESQAQAHDHFYSATSLKIYLC